MKRITCPVCKGWGTLLDYTPCLNCEGEGFLVMAPDSKDWETWFDAYTRRLFGKGE